MTIRNLFKRVQEYNEIADLLKTGKADIYFNEGLGFGNHFKTYKEFSKFIRAEFVNEVVKVILENDEYTVDQTEYVLNWVDKFGKTHTNNYEISITYA